jgi:hypothetical protein
MRCSPTRTTLLPREREHLFGERIERPFCSMTARRRPPLTEPLTMANRTSNGVASGDDLLRLSASVLGAVNGVRDEMVRSFEATNKKLDGVCDTVAGLVTDKAVATALKAQTREVIAGQEAQSQKHVLDIRWRVGIVMGAVTGSIAATGTLFTIAYRIATGH